MASPSCTEFAQLAKPLEDSGGREVQIDLDAKAEKRAIVMQKHSPKAPCITFPGFAVGYAALLIGVGVYGLLPHSRSKSALSVVVRKNQPHAPSPSSSFASATGNHALSTTNPTSAELAVLNQPASRPHLRSRTPLPSAAATSVLPLTPDETIECLRQLDWTPSTTKLGRRLEGWRGPLAQTSRCFLRLVVPLVFIFFIVSTVSKAGCNNGRCCSESGWCFMKEPFYQRYTNMTNGKDFFLMYLEFFNNTCLKIFQKTGEQEEHSFVKCSDYQSNKCNGVPDMYSGFACHSSSQTGYVETFVHVLSNLCALGRNDDNEGSFAMKVINKISCKIVENKRRQIGV
eukprot:GHVT01065077.1.p1 GENE.GHVT01065077.1~~GHVT01065077.1.p1  ORF type:complete len:343 (+),score=23.68 GHVT01065077.1:316-1344(+)